MDHSIRERRNDETLSTDPDRYMHHGEELPPTNLPMASDVAGIPQRIHPKLGNMTDLCAAIKAGVGALGFSNIPGLRIERKIYGALIDALIEQQDPTNGPLLELVQMFNAGVCRDIDEVLDVQDDLLEQPSSTLRESDNLPPLPVDRTGEGDSATRCGYCAKVTPYGGIYCDTVCKAKHANQVHDAEALSRHLAGEAVDQVDELRAGGAL